MNILLWILQILLALHTAVGAGWKFFNSEQAVPSLSAIPHGAWLAISVFELACVAGLLIPAVYRPLAILAPLVILTIYYGVHPAPVLDAFAASTDALLKSTQAALGAAKTAALVVAP